MRLLIRGQAGAVGGGVEALKLLLQPVGLAAPVTRLAGFLPRQLPPFSLAGPGGNAAHDETEREGA